MDTSDKKINTVPYESPRASTDLLQQRQRSLFPFSIFFYKVMSVPDGNQSRKPGLKILLFMKIPMKRLIPDSSGVGLRVLVARRLHCSLQTVPSSRAMLQRFGRSSGCTSPRCDPGMVATSPLLQAEHPAPGKRAPSISRTPSMKLKSRGAFITHT